MESPKSDRSSSSKSKRSSSSKHRSRKSKSSSSRNGSSSNNHHHHQEDEGAPTTNQPIEAESIELAVMNAPLLVQELVHTYKIMYPPNILFKKPIDRIRIHKEFCSTSRQRPILQPGQPGQNSAALVGHEWHHSNKQESFAIPIPTKKEELINLVAIGINRWTITGDVSIGINFSGQSIPKPTIMGSSSFVKTLPANGSNNEAEPIFVIKPDSHLRTNYPDMTVEELTKNIPSYPQQDKVALPYEFRDKKPYCPIGFILKEALDAIGEDYDVDEAFGVKCIILEKKKYQTLLDEKKKDLDDTRIVWNVKENMIELCPSNQTNKFHASIIFDIYYCPS